MENLSEPRRQWRRRRRRQRRHNSPGFRGTSLFFVSQPVSIMRSRDNTLKQFGVFFCQAVGTLQLIYYFHIPQPVVGYYSNNTWEGILYCDYGYDSDLETYAHCRQQQTYPQQYYNMFSWVSGLLCNSYQHMCSVKSFPGRKLTCTWQ